MRRRWLLALWCAPLVLRAQPVQRVVLADGTDSRTGTPALRQALSGPHVVRAGQGSLEIRRDTVVSSSLVVLGRPTYVAGRVEGDVVVVGADLFLRPGANVTGRAIAIGGTVATTTLGTVAGGVESVRDEEVSIARDADAYVVTLRDTREESRTPLFQPAGLYGVRMPAYDRVDGLSLPIGVVVTLGDDAVVIEPTVTYRSRLGLVDPSASLNVAPDRPFGFVGRAGRMTRTNDAWIYSDFVNSLTTFFAGSDTRNYFRSDLGEGRFVARWRGATDTLDTYVGGRRERLRAITAGGNVWSVTGRHSEFKIPRPNPLVEEGNLGSALLGGEMRMAHGPVTARLTADAEQGLATPAGTSRFLQLTLDGRVEFPTFGLQRLYVRGHAVATHGDTVPLARYAYLGGSGTLRTLENLEIGGTSLFYLENRYVMPIKGLVLPFVGFPEFTIRDAFGSAGVGSLPSFQHEVGAGVGLNWIRLEVVRGVAGRKRTEVGVGLSFRR